VYAPIGGVLRRTAREANAPRKLREVVGCRLIHSPEQRGLCGISTDCAVKPLIHLICVSVRRHVRIVHVFLLEV
jgi:hypothetical protein